MATASRTGASAGIASEATTGSEATGASGAAKRECCEETDRWARALRRLTSDSEVSAAACEAGVAEGRLDRRVRAGSAIGASKGKGRGSRVGVARVEQRRARTGF